MFFEISAGKYKATVTAEGAGLASFTHDGRNLILPHDPGEQPSGFNGRVLVPWPNRIAGGTYVFEGRLLSVPINEPDRNAALHGLQCWNDWELVKEDGHSVQLRVLTGPTDGYPFKLETRIRYSLDALLGLHIEISSSNVGEDPAPYGTGTHAYLTCDGASIDQCVLTVPASEVAMTDQNLIPTGLAPVDDTQFDLREGRVLKGVSLDHAFTGIQLEPDSKTWQVSLKDTESGMIVALTSDEPWLQIFTAEPQDRRGVAVEPMTCPPNAFNTGQDLVVLAPGMTHTHWLRIFETV